MHEITFNHSERWIYLLLLTTLPPAKHDKTNIICTCKPWSLSPFSHHHSGQRIIHVPVASRRLWGSPQNIGVAAIQCGSLSCNHPGATLALLNSFKWSACPFKTDHMSRSQEREVWRSVEPEDRPLVQILLLPTHGLPCSECSEKKLTWGRNMGVHQGEKRHESLFFTASFKERQFFLPFAWFFFYSYVLMVINWNTPLTYREKERSPSPPCPEPPLLSIPTLSAVFPPVSQSGHLHRLVNGSSLNVHMWNT